MQYSGSGNFFNFNTANVIQRSVPFIKAANAIKSVPQARRCIRAACYCICGRGKVAKPYDQKQKCFPTERVRTKAKVGPHLCIELSSPARPPQVLGPHFWHHNAAVDMQSSATRTAPYIMCVLRGVVSSWSSVTTAA